MKRLWVILFCLCSFSLTGQTVDVTEYSQNIALKDTVIVPADSTQLILNTTYPSISEIYQIPAYSLYDRYWDVQNLRSRTLDIPFANDRLMLLLVQDVNHNFVFPCTYNELAQPYGPTKKGDFHPGVDLSVDYQTLVKNCFDGVVRMAKTYGDYGLLVVIRHYNGLETVYAHLDKICVKPGQMVNAGDVIGQTGRSGNVKECVLHFETRFMNEPFDPALVIDFDEEDLLRNTLSLTPEDFRIVPIDETAASGAAPQTGTVLDFDSDNGNSQYHIVKKGETLYRIAQEHHTTMDRILKLNNLENPDKITEGQKLRVK